MAESRGWSSAAWSEILLWPVPVREYSVTRSSIGEYIIDRFCLSLDD